MKAARRAASGCKTVCEHAFGNGGTLLVRAFSIGRTQELLYELEDIMRRNRSRPAAAGIAWSELDIIVDSPLAADFTAGYVRLKRHWNAEARRRESAGRHPLSFEQLTTIGDHATHLRMVEKLARGGRWRSSSQPAACAATGASSTI